MGSKGPRANWRSVDQIAQGMSGIMSITGTRLVFITRYIKAETIRSLFAAVTAGA